MLSITSKDLRLERRQRRAPMSAPFDPAALSNALQALTTVLKTFQANPTAAPAAAAPADYVNIMDAFESVNPFDLGSRAGYSDFAKASAPIEKT